MDKKELKFYEAPVCDIVELKAHVTLLAGSTEQEKAEDPDEESEL